ncbi:MAG: radical SAM protein [Chloroflexota bacterium]|nr:radical SAM protein [Chloroflexota bacterium]
MLAFGPVPSRRLGRSLGVNNIPPKTCTYACVYCQVGRTTRMSLERRTFYPPAEIIEAVERKLEQDNDVRSSLDFITFVADGEPTLDINLGQEITTLKDLGYRIAVISNASLIWMPEVRAELAQADWVSLKVDSVQEGTWRKINRPHRKLSLEAMLDGMLVFARDFTGELVTETMAVHGVNDDESDLTDTAAFIGRLQPAGAYISIPTRPPAEPWVQPAGEEALHLAYRVFEGHVGDVELNIEYEGDDFAATGDAAADLLSITAVHPMREDAVFGLLERAGADKGLIDELVAGGMLAGVEYRGQRFYIRRFSRSGHA